jgi:predicted O-methyltransferase YrrM
MEDKLAQYVVALFAAEDAPLAGIRQRHKAAGLPEIHISPDEGKLLHLLLRTIGARRVLELGTLGGYSAVWMARALPPGGRLTTIESERRHADVARQAFRESGVADRVELIEGVCLDVLPRLTPGFDAVFVDADKEPLPQYFEHAVRLVRVGGLVLCDNAFYHGAVVDPSDRSAGADGVREYNRLAATDPRLVSTVVPVRDGLVVSLRVQ